MLNASALPSLSRAGGFRAPAEPNTGIPLAALQENDNDDLGSSDSGDLEIELAASLPSLVLRSTAPTLTLQRTSNRNPITSAIHQRRFGQPTTTMTELEEDSLSSGSSEQEAPRQQQ